MIIFISICKQNRNLFEYLFYYQRKIFMASSLCHNPFISIHNRNILDTQFQQLFNRAIKMINLYISVPEGLLMGRNANIPFHNTV